MTNKIKTLNSHLTNMIAAGEVVERPAGIIKELVENSLDAKADRIEVRVKEGGMEVIEVIDNGEGMSFSDLKLAFERHSTSKIKQEADLTKISTFGFRGEALPSIASVSLVEASSNDGEESSKIVIDNGQEIEHSPFARNKGTSVKVYHLFTQLPARLKHIKNLHYETAIILDIIQKFALGNPKVSFSFYNNDKLSFQSLGHGNMEDIYYRIYGKDVSQDSFYFKDENYDFNIEGIYTLPNHNKANRYSMWIYVNQRMIRYPKLQNAILDAYRRHLPVGRNPIIMMNITTDPELVDVNVHPSKWEIRMAQERELLTLVQNRIEGLLYKENRAPKIKISEPEQFSIKDELLEARPTEKIIESVQEPQEIVENLQETIIPSKPLTVKETDSFTEAIDKLMVDYEPEEEVIQEQNFISKIEPLKVLSQMSGKYILAQGDEGLYIIDQHAAMERIRYEYYQEKLLNKKNPTQPLLIPLVFEGRTALIPMLNDINDELTQFQLQLDVFAEDSLILREIPQWLSQIEAKDFVSEILDLFEKNRKIREEDLRRDALATLACHSSVRFNEYLSYEEMVKLVEDLRMCDQPYHCPHGRPTLISISHSQLIKEFKR
ncbi:DNA mismatch repair endonuclease MutL [Erysipelothrix urinaevulpis]|uniref:DNA mismatch repair endonuclease MutL n=1 Tax=Erysipelothrix urinaevulpis TaxID=2683717 RepID=UPI001357F8C6|nr:DNA mismatch repair endonuclease MutL [Erysipelothrix urinaevulpis]